MKCEKKHARGTAKYAQNVSTLYHPGKHMYLTDTLSRAFIHSVAIHDDEEDSHETDYLPIKEERIAELKAATLVDHSMQRLQNVMLKGCPEVKHLLDSEVRPYFNFRNEMTV